MSDRKLDAYSYHTFALPFFWEGMSYEQLVKLFETHKVWYNTDTDNDNSYPASKSSGEATLEWFCPKVYGTEKEREMLFYKIHQYFYPQVRDVIFGNGKSVVSNYTFSPLSIRNNKESYYKIVKESYNYLLRIDAIRLKIYNTGVAILIFECENPGVNEAGAPQTSMDDIKRINEWGRRIVFPFIPDSEDGFSLCADRLEVCIPDVSNDGFRIAFKEISSKMHGEDGKTKVQANLNHVASFVKEILGCGMDQSFSSGDARGKNIAIVPALDDRMFVGCIVRDTATTHKWFPKNNPLLYKTDKSISEDIYEYMFVDIPKDCSCQSDDMRQELLEKHLYRRWINYGTMYAVEAQSLVALHDNEPYLDHLTETFLYIYMQIAYLCLMQKASLIRFQKEATDLSEEIRKKSRKHREAAKLMSLQESLARFESQLCFVEISSEEQGIEMYDMFLDHFGIKRQLENVKSQVDYLHNATDTYLDLTFNKIGYIFAILGALYGLEEIFLPYFFEQKPGAWNLHVLILASSVIVGAIVWLVVAFIYRKYRRK